MRQRVVVQEGRPNKKVYALTASGRAALRTWITEPPERAPSRDELLLKTYSLWLADPREALALFEAEGKRHRAQLAEYEGFAQQMRQSRKHELGDPSTPDFATYATLLRGVGHERAYLAWCRWMVARLRKRPATGPGAGPSGGRRRRRPAK